MSIMHDNVYQDNVYQNNVRPLMFMNKNAIVDCIKVD